MLIDIDISPPCDFAEADGSPLDCVLAVGHLVISSPPSHLRIQNIFCSHIDENSWDAGRRELNDRNKRCDEHKHSNFRCDLTCADQTALKDLSGLMMVTKS